MKKGLKRMDDKAFILSKKFRTAIERAKREGEFDSDPTLKHFPKACCGSASSLLAKFLYENCTEIARKVGQQYSKMYNAILA